MIEEKKTCWIHKLCMKETQTLVNISLERCDLNDFVELTNLKKLWITESQSGQLEKLKNMLVSKSVTYDHPRSLTLTADRFGDIPIDIVLRCVLIYTSCNWREKSQGRLPEELLRYPNLTKITLKLTKLKDYQIGILEKLPKLRVLELWYQSLESETLVFSQGGFPHLEFLYLDALNKLKEWRVEKEAMPRLHRSRIQECSKLRAVPDGLQDVTTLKELTINEMPRSFCSRVGEGGEDFYKIKHVPSLIITHMSLEPEMEESTSQVAGQAAGDESDQESTVGAPPAADEKTEKMQASSLSPYLSVLI